MSGPGPRLRPGSGTTPAPETYTPEFTMWLMSERTRDHRLPDLAGYADTRPAWMKDGACRGQDPGVFVTDKIESIRRPKALCSTCGVRDECLDYAMADVELQGVWGMTSERDRARIRAQRAA